MQCDVFTPGRPPGGALVFWTGRPSSRLKMARVARVAGGVWRTMRRREFVVGLAGVFDPANFSCLPAPTGYRMRPRYGIYREYLLLGHYRMPGRAPAGVASLPN